MREDRKEIRDRKKCDWKEGRTFPIAEGSVQKELSSKLQYEAIECVVKHLTCRAMCSLSIVFPVNWEEHSLSCFLILFVPQQSAHPTSPR